MLGKLPKFHDDNLIVGIETSDDAAIYKVTDEIAMIQTVDFFTPIVDDPYMFGQIAAANSLSDVWAMGGEPAVALNIVGFPNCLDPAILGDILAGGADKVKEAGAVLVGGHSVQDDEPKYGLCVSGFVHPDKIFKNYGCRPGDVLVLTKQIGSGIINTAVKAEMASPSAIREAQTVMASLNKKAKRLALKSVLSAKASEANIVVIDAIKMDAPKTSEFAKFLKAVGCEGKTLVVTAAADQNVVKSGRNIPGCEVTFAGVLNVYDVLNATKLVVDKAALATIEEVFA